MEVPLLENQNDPNKNGESVSAGNESPLDSHLSPESVQMG